MQAFDVTMRIQANAGNIKPVVAQIQRQLSSAPTLNTRAHTAATQVLLKNIASVNTASKALSGTLGNAAAFTAASIGVRKLASAMGDATREAIQFQKSMVELRQIGVQNGAELKSISDNILKLSTGLGVSSNELANQAKYFKGAGLSIQETNEALKVMAKVNLSPTFESVTKAREALIAMSATFKIGAKDFEATFDKLNEVAKSYAVESEDLVEAVQRSGAAFAAASGNMVKPQQQLEQLIGLFTSVRSETRESAATIGTAFRTIFANLQNNRVQNELKNLGINLRFTSDEAAALGRNVEGNFVGAYEAIRRLNAATRHVDTNSAVFSNIVELVGGKRNTTRVIPLIQKFGKAQEAVSVAQASQNSLTRDAEKAQDAFAVKLEKVHQAFVKLGVAFTQSKTFNVLIDGFTNATTAAASLVEALEPLLPIVAALGANRLGLALGGYIGARLPTAAQPALSSVAAPAASAVPSAVYQIAPYLFSPASAARAAAKTVAPGVALPTPAAVANPSLLFGAGAVAANAVPISGDASAYDVVAEREPRPIGAIFNQRTGQFEAPRGTRRAYFGPGVAKHLDYNTTIMPNQRYQRDEAARILRRRRAVRQGIGVVDREGAGFGAIPLSGDSYYVHGDGTEVTVSARQARRNRAAIDAFVTSGGFGSGVRGYAGTKADYDELHGSFNGMSLAGMNYAMDSEGRLHKPARRRLRLPRISPRVASAGTGALFAAGAFAPMVLSAETKSGASATGALVGAVSGAAVGSAGGPIGAAVGAVVGGLTGLVSSLKDAEKRIRDIRFQKDSAKLTKALADDNDADVKAGLAALEKRITPDDGYSGNFLSRVASGISDTAQGVYYGLQGKAGEHFKNQEIEERRKLIEEHVTPHLQAFDQRATNLYRDNPKSSELGQIVKLIAEATNRSEKEVTAELEKRKQANAVSLKVLDVQNQSIQEFTRLTAAVDAATNSVAHLEASADALQSAFHGTLSTIGVRNRSADAHLGNLDATAFNAAASHVSAHLGAAGVGFGQTARGLNQASVSLPDIISAARAGTPDGGNLSAAIKEGIHGSSLDAPLKKKLADIIEDMNPADIGEQVKGNLQKFAEELVEKAAPGFGAAFQHAAQALDQRMTAFANGLTANQGMLSQLGESRDRGASLGIQALRSRTRFAAESAGRPSDAGDIGLAALEADRFRQNRLAGNAGFNPEAIGAKLAATQAQITATKAARDNATGPDVNALSERLAELQGNAQRLNQALEHLADTSERNAAIQERISKLEEDRQGRIGFTERFLTSDARGQRQMAVNAHLSDIAVSQGHFGGFSAGNVQRVIEHLTSLGNATLPAYGGRTASDVHQQLVRNSGLAIGTIDPRSERARLNLIGQQAGNDAVAVRAQDALVKNQATLQQQFFTELKGIESEFLTKLQQTLTGQLKPQGKDRVAAGLGQLAAPLPGQQPPLGGHVVNNRQVNIGVFAAQQQQQQQAAADFVGPPVPPGLRRLTKRQRLILNNRRQVPLKQPDPNFVGPPRPQAFTGVMPPKGGQQFRRRDDILRPKHAEALRKAQEKVQAAQQGMPAPPKPAPAAKPVQPPVQNAPNRAIQNRHDDVGMNSFGKDVGAFNTAVASFGSFLNGFAKEMAKVDGMKMSLEKNGRVEVVLNGAEVMRSLQSDLAKSVAQDVLSSLQAQLPKILGDMPARV